ncbi:MAG: ATP-binding cassette domain-containing protein [Paludibacteraceae bacterium]|jgi:ABC-2 type transport system ATP-binding protein|nr:ATP-binding cassette domain-containing protein [Paludibacteraceae bacterium]
MAIHIEHLNKTIGKQKVLEDITLRIEDGEIVGLLGPNGAGKSTLMKILVGLWNPDNMESLKQTTQSNGYLPEQNPLYNEMYVQEYLLLMARLHHIPSPHLAVQKLILQVGLEQEVTKKIGELSKGYKQRVGIAQALIANPQLLVLDEPTTGLDPNQLKEIRSLIREIGKERTVILSTHIMQEVREMCDRVVLLNKGQLKVNQKVNEIDDLEELFRQATV